jgi:hypothetical protein
MSVPHDVHDVQNLRFPYVEGIAKVQTKVEGDRPTRDELVIRVSWG